jgi:hypothetical protein
MESQIKIKLKTAEKELLDAVKQQLAEQPELQYADALKLVASKNPNLVRRYKSAVMSDHE